MLCRGGLTETANAEYYERAQAYSPARSRVRSSLLVLGAGLSALLRADGRANRRMTRYLARAASSSERILDVGFGNGDWLAGVLKQGRDAHGVDTSGEAVARFRRLWPEYADRVSVSGPPEGTYDLVRAYAVVEHVDQAADFVGKLARGLVPGGRLAIAVPTRSPEPEADDWRHDINYWAPYHRVVMSRDGLERMLVAHGLTIERISHADLYAYRVLNAMLRDGYDAAQVLRNAASVGAGWPGSAAYARELARAWSARSAALWTKVIARKEAARRSAGAGSLP